MKFKYRLKDPGSIPVNNYSANVSVKQVGDTSNVTFKGAFLGFMLLSAYIPYEILTFLKIEHLKKICTKGHVLGHRSAFGHI